MLVLQSIGGGPGGGLGSDTRSGADGSFLLPRVISGRYELHARLNRKPNEGAILPLVVASDDITNWTIPLTAGGRMIGQVIPPANAPPVSASELTIVATPVGETLVFGTGFGGQIKDDWTFDWDFLLGSRIIRASQLPRGWTLKAVMRGEEDVTDKPIAFSGAEVVNDLQIVLTTESTTLSGGAIDGAGRPATDYTAVVFSEDSAKWVYWTRHIKSARPDDSGRFTIEGLPSGRYKVAALKRVEQHQWLDRQFLTRVAADAQSITLKDADPATITLKVIDR
jgi:hypothetical protein